jgi:hypothetical protein
MDNAQHAAQQKSRTNEGDTSKVLEELERVRHGIQVCQKKIMFWYPVAGTLFSPKTARGHARHSSNQIVEQ